MLDVSDGLAIDGRRIATASGVRLDIRTEHLESPASLVGGEAHALLATFPPEAVLPGGFRAIGTVEMGEGVSVDGVAFDARGGWDPYVDGER